VIPEADARKLRELGVGEVFGPGSSLREISSWLESALDARTEEAV
jgi:methylmalonyl-CoA mutase cobalamin-binding subunit